MTIVGWVDQETVQDYWADSVQLEDSALTSYLQASYEQCVEFLPPVALKAYPETIPDRWKQAQIMQARALYRSAVAGSGDQVGMDGQGVTVFPMDWTVKNLLRPSRIGRVM